MAVHRVDGESEIIELFTQEGDALEKAGFQEPDLSHTPEEYPITGETAGPEGLASVDPTGAGEYADNHYTEVNRKLVEDWRAAEAAGDLGATATIWRPLNTN